MPEDSFEEKTEPATPRRRQEARERGHVARSTDLNSAVILLAAIIALNFFGKSLAEGMLITSNYIFEHLGTIDIDRNNISGFFYSGMYVVIMSVLPFLIIITVFALAINLLQVGFVLNSEPLTPNLDRLNPISGLQRLFSLRGFIKLLAGMFKVLAVGTVLFMTIWSERFRLLALVDMDFRQIVEYIVEISLLLSLRAALVLIVIALLDFGYQRWQYEKDLRMSKFEIKEEMKRLEGDPKVRERRRVIQRQLALQRMMQKVPKATVVITNPTEIAVALQYEKGEMDAPIVVAKGMGLIAERIRNIAVENSIPIIEKPPLARALYKMVEVGQVIHPDLYEAVAEVLAYVYKLKGMAAVA